MSDSPSRLIRTADPTQPSVPHHKLSGKVPPVRIFQQDWLEALTLISFRTFLLFCMIFESIVLAVVFYHDHHTLCRAMLLFCLGLPLWWLTEYALHRFVFHFISQNERIQRLVYIFHGNHHIQPNHPYRTLMPIIVTLPLGLALWALAVSILGTGTGSALFAGFFAGYSFYDSIHFATHNFSMKHFPLSIWKRHHLLHHYKTEEHNYSISMPWIDTIFSSKYKK